MAMEMVRGAAAADSRRGQSEKTGGEAKAVAQLTDWQERFHQHVYKTAEMSDAEGSRNLLEELKTICSHLPSRSWSKLDLFPFCYLFADVHCRGIARKLYHGEMFPTSAVNSECKDMRLEARSELLACFLDMMQRSANGERLPLQPPFLGIADREGGARVAYILNRMKITLDKSFGRWFAKNAASTGAMSFNQACSEYNACDAVDDVSLADAVVYHEDNYPKQIAESLGMTTEDLESTLQASSTREYIKCLASASCGRRDTRPLRVEIVTMVVCDGRSIGEAASDLGRDKSVVYRHIRSFGDYLREEGSLTDLFLPDSLHLAD